MKKPIDCHKTECFMLGCKQVQAYESRIKELEAQQAKFRKFYDQVAGSEDDQPLDVVHSLAARIFGHFSIHSKDLITPPTQEGGKD